MTEVLQFDNNLKLSPDHCRRLAGVILGLPEITVQARRDLIVSNLPQHIASSVVSHSGTRDHVLSIVIACTNYVSGLPALCETLRFFYHDTYEFNKLINTIREIAPETISIAPAPPDRLADQSTAKGNTGKLTIEVRYAEFDPVKVAQLLALAKDLSTDASIHFSAQALEN